MECIHIVVNTCVIQEANNKYIIIESKSGFHLCEKSTFTLNLNQVVFLRVLNISLLRASTPT
jgi:hypothetical protein